MMQFSNVHINLKVGEFLRNLSPRNPDYIDVNQTIKLVSGILDFFSCQEELEELVAFLSVKTTTVHEPDRTEYGDFQTNQDLALRVANLLQSEGAAPESSSHPAP